MVDPKVSPNICILETFPVVLLGISAHKGHRYNGLVPRQLLAYITRPHSVESSVVGTFTA